MFAAIVACSISFFAASELCPKPSFLEISTFVVFPAKQALKLEPENPASLFDKSRFNSSSAKSIPVIPSITSIIV